MARRAALSPIGRLVERQRAAALAALQAANPPSSTGEGDLAQPETGIPVTEQAQALSAPSPLAEREGPADTARPMPGLAEAGIPAEAPEPGTWRLAELGPSQCRFACTPHNARPEAHRFCGQPTRVGPGNLHGSWCPDHLSLVWSGAKTAGGASRADAERERGVA